MDDYDKTRGELYKFAENEQEYVDTLNHKLTEIYDKLDELKAYAENRDMYCVEYYPYGERQFITNGNTPVRIGISVDDSWLSSTQDC